VASARDLLGGEEAVDAERFWTSVRDHTHPFFTTLHEQGTPLWRLSVRSTTPFRDLGRDQLIEWGGALRWLAAPADGADEKLRAFARASGGHATCFRDGSGAVFQALSPPMLALHQRLKNVFDPHGILNRGRLYPEL
jgi:glycolate oxidase FAD binding subunit